MKLSLAALLAAFAISFARAQSAPPTYHFAPDKAYHLVHPSTTFNVDEQHQRATGSVVDTFQMLRNGVTTVHFDTSAEKVTDVRLDGRAATFTQNGRNLEVAVPTSRTGDTHRLSVKIEGRSFRCPSPPPRSRTASASEPRGSR